VSVPESDTKQGLGQYNRTLLFVLSCVALTAAGMVFSLRATVMEDLGTAFVGVEGLAEGESILSAKLVGQAVGAAFLGFALSVLIGSPLCDYLGMRFLLALAAVLHIGGTLLTVFSPSLTSILSPYWLLWLGMLTVGLAHGLVEAVINPLIATLYPDDKTHRMNVLHAWWPGGLIIGGLIGYFMHHQLDLNWQMRLAVVLAPAILYGAMVVGTRFPPTERVAAGVSSRDMWKEATRPLFIALFLCMFLTAASELGPGQWIDATLSKTVGFAGILVLVYVSGLMFVLRHFAGALAHSLSPIGLMWVSSLLAGLGLLAISAVRSPVPAVLAATVWGAGVCFMWPTMLGIVSERFPKGGAWVLGLMGTAGNLAIYKLLPFMGGIYDTYTQQKLADADPGVLATVGTCDLSVVMEKAAAGDQVAKQLLDAAGSEAVPFAFRYVAAGCIALVIVFGMIWLRDRAAGGYKAVRLDAENSGDEDGPEAEKDAAVE